MKTEFWVLVQLEISEVAGQIFSQFPSIKYELWFKTGFSLGHYIRVRSLQGKWLNRLIGCTTKFTQSIESNRNLRYKSSLSALFVYFPIKVVQNRKRYRQCTGSSIDA